MHKYTFMTTSDYSVCQGWAELTIHVLHIALNKKIIKTLLNFLNFIKY